MYSEKEFLRRFITVIIMVGFVMSIYTGYKRGVFSNKTSDIGDSSSINSAKQKETRRRIEQYTLYLNDMNRELISLESSASVDLISDLDLERIYLKSLENK